MKNVLIAGSIIGVLSGVWLWVLYLIGNAAFFDDVLTIVTSGKPFKDMGILLGIAMLIPIIGLYFGLRLYKQHEKGGEITFSEAFTTSLKILITGGTLAVIFATLYRYAIAKGTISEFTELALGALLFGLIVALTLSFLLKTKLK
ncbi:MAG TPA: DUF4199 domain-containing protein [Hanamia sp.]|jgi:hypothetical protein